MNNLLVFSDVFRQMAAVKKLYGNTSTGNTAGLDPNAYGFGNARKVWETLRRSSQNMAIWASERMLFDPTKTCCVCYIYFIAKVLCCLAIRTEEIQ